MFISSKIISPSQPFLNMFPCRGRQNDAKVTKIKTGCTLEAAVELLPPAHHLLCKHLCLFMHILYNVCQFLRLAPTPALRFYGDLLYFFSRKLNPKIGRIMHFCRRTHKCFLRWQLGVMPTAGVQTCYRRASVCA